MAAEAGLARVQRRPDAVEFVDRAPYGLTCFAPNHDGGSVIVENSGVASAMFVVSAGLATLGIAAFVDVLLASTVTQQIRCSRLQPIDGYADRCALLRAGIGAFMLPLMMLGQYLQWYSAAQSGGSGICPDSVGGDGVLGFSDTAGPHGCRGHSR